jgi:tRNA threonylcarbamoyladenosine biosynthesis protein TsaE
VYTTKSEQDTKNLGKNFGSDSKGGEVFLLTGELGSGKTQFAKGLAEGLGITDHITSPTFNYENIYEARDGLRFYHFDLYREEVLDEDIKLMLEEATADLKGVVAVEWSERLGGELPNKYQLVQFEWVAENERNITIKIQSSNNK